MVSHPVEQLTFSGGNVVNRQRLFFVKLEHKGQDQQCTKHPGGEGQRHTETIGQAVAPVCRRR